MIVGNGLIANSFKKSKISFEEYIIFASGVSNSQEQRESEFEREKELILSYKKSTKKFIYFSSIHILDPSQKDLKYVKHKLEMEKLIKNNFTNYNIYRLPIVMGRGGNKDSLFNFLYNSIKNQKQMEIYNKSYRYVIGVDDIVEFVFKTIGVNNKIINLVFNRAFNIMEIIQCFENNLNTLAKYNSIDKGAFFEVENNVISQFFSEDILAYYGATDYLNSIIKKYYINRESKL